MLLAIEVIDGRSSGSDLAQTVSIRRRRLYRSALDRDSMAMAEESYNWSLAHPGPYASQFQGTPGSPDKFYQDLLNGKVLTGYRHLLESSNAADIVAELWDSPDVWFFYEQVFLKEGGESRRTPWHQDASYLPIDGEQLAVMWITFDPVSKADCLEFVRASHHGILYYGSRFEPGDDTAPLYGTLPRLPDIEASRDRFDILSWDVDPGDVLIFHPAMLHGERRRTAHVAGARCHCASSATMLSSRHAPGIWDIREKMPRLSSVKSSSGSAPAIHSGIPRS